MIFIPNEQIIFIPHVNQVYLIAYSHTKPNVANLAWSLMESGLLRTEGETETTSEWSEHPLGYTLMINEGLGGIRSATSWLFELKMSSF
jgi:hypothetical protein